MGSDNSFSQRLKLDALLTKIKKNSASQILGSLLITYPISIFGLNEWSDSKRWYIIDYVNQFRQACKVQDRL